MTPWTLLLALIIGGLMGLLGGGGSIVAVPALTLALHLAPKEAVATSLAVVGIVAAIGAAGALARGVLPLRLAAIVGAASIAGASIGGRVGAQLPDRLQLSILAGVMMAAAVMVWRRGAPAAAASTHERPLVLAAIGLAVGTLTGLVGVGGGFLTVPALVVVAGLTMQRAAAASLFSIALAALAALPGYAAHATIGWSFIAPFAIVASAGALAGGRAADRLPQRRLQQAFAITLVILGSYVFMTA